MPSIQTVMVATDGTLDPEIAASMADRLAGPDGSIMVVSVVELPTRMLLQMRATMAESIPKTPEAMVEYQTRRADESRVSWIGDDAFVANYVRTVSEEAVGPLVAALKEMGHEPKVLALEGENAYQSIIDAVQAHKADVLCIGTHGLGRFDGLLGSTSTKLARRAPCSVVLVR